MKSGVFFIFLFFITTSIIAQIEQPRRFEVELDVFDEEYNVLSGDDDGLLVYKPLDIYNGRDQLWKFIKLDTTLNVQWQKDYYIDKTLVYRGFDYTGSVFSLLFQITEKNSLDLLLLQHMIH